RIGWIVGSSGTTCPRATRTSPATPPRRTGRSTAPTCSSSTSRSATDLGGARDDGSAQRGSTAVHLQARVRARPALRRITVELVRRATDLGLEGFTTYIELRTGLIDRDWLRDARLRSLVARLGENGGDPWRLALDGAGVAGRDLV